MTFRGSKTGENFHNTDVVKVGFASVNYQQRELFFLQLPRTSKKCKLHWSFWSTRSGKVWSWGKAIQDLFLLLLLQGFFSGMLFFCSLLVEQEISLEKKKKTDQTAQIPRRKSRRRFGGLLEWPKTTSSPMPKLVQFFGCRADEDTVPSLDVFFPHEKSKHQNPWHFTVMVVGSGSRIPISFSWFIIIWSLYNWVVSSLKIVC